MTSAALRTLPFTTAPHHNLSPIQSSPENRRYRLTPASQSGKGYPTAAGVDSECHPADIRTSTRELSGNGNTTSNGYTTSQLSLQDDSSLKSRFSTVPTNPIMAGRPSDRQTTTDDQIQHIANMVPPRSSSTQRPPGSSGSSSITRRAVPNGGQGNDAPRQEGYDTNYSSGPGREPRGQRAASNTQDAAYGASNPNRQSQSQSQSQRTTNASYQNQDGSSQALHREPSEIFHSTSYSEDLGHARESAVPAQPHATSYNQTETMPPSVAPLNINEQSEQPRGQSRSRQDHSGRREKHSKFGEYILGNTIGEGEFGKVKLGWKQEGGVQVAIKLIKKDQVGSNPTRMAKIRREVNILKELSHPNIVRLHKMEESERHFGIVLEYASGGELFDYILKHRYLKDNAARKLFAQLISGVGYLHKKGIVHRDLKLENLLLDRNRNIIVTDFGFANKFDPNDELTEMEESALSDREYVKRMHLHDVKPDGSRKGDLMQTSCGSPCYAAPELVVSDSLYTGRKVDVWSCGVILYAMLAGYLPFDDDPANPEGDNINLLYKYITSTPLTFPEYVTPHARDLLRRILVPDPRKRADLFEVARHSWLGEYAHVVEFITSSTTAPSDVQDVGLRPDDEYSAMPVRSASVREPTKRQAPQTAIGGLISKQGTIDPDAQGGAYAKQQKDAKRRTVQLEYVAPTTTTQRGEQSAVETTPTRSRARSSSRGPAGTPKDKPLPQDPPVSKDSYGKSASRRPPSAHQNSVLTPTRPARDGARATSEQTILTSTTAGNIGRPNPEANMGSMKMNQRHSSYGQPSAPAVADANARGRIQQPNSRRSSSYQQSQNMQQEDGPETASIGMPSRYAQANDLTSQNASTEKQGHRRSNTLGELGGRIFGRSGSLFGHRKQSDQVAAQMGEKNKKYPPVSMTAPMPAGDDRRGRPSMESRRSRRSFSIGLGRKASGSMTDSLDSREKKTKRFSLLPNSLSLKSIGLGKHDYDESRQQSQHGMQNRVGSPSPLSASFNDQQYEAGAERLDTAPAESRERLYDQTPPQTAPAQMATRPSYNSRQNSASNDRRPSAIPQYLQQPQSASVDRVSSAGSGSRASFDNYQGRAPSRSRQPSSSQYMQQPPQQQQQQQQQYQQADDGNIQQQEYSGDYGNVEYDAASAAPIRQNGRRSSRTVLQKPKRFVDAYDNDGYTQQHDHAGSSGAARKVMDFFRRRGKARGGEVR